MIVDYIKLWRYVSLKDGAIDEHELVSISFHLAQEFPREMIKNELEKFQNGFEEQIDTTVKRIKKKYEAYEHIKLLLSLYLFFMHEEDLKEHSRMKKIFDAFGYALEDFENIFSDVNRVVNIPHLHFYKKEIEHDFFQGFKYVLFEIKGEYRFVLRKGENLFIDGHSIRSKNRAMLLNEQQEFEFRDKNSSLTLHFKEMIALLKDENRSELFDKIERKSEIKIDTIEKITKIDMKNLSCGFDKEIPRTKNLNICLKQGDFVAIIGPSGSGKSTLLKTIMGMNYINAGELVINDEEPYKQGDESKLSKHINHIGYVSQQELFIRELSVYDNLYYYYSLFHTKRDKETFTKDMEKILKQLGIYKQLHQQTSSLSGGQRKKLNIALELIKNPDVLFIDEPTSGLSSQEALELIEFLRELSLEGKMVFTVIHQPSLEMYKQYNKVIILNKDGDNIYSGDAQKALNIFCSVLSENNEDADPNILLKTTKAHDNFWYTLGDLNRFLKAKQ